MKTKKQILAMSKEELFNYKWSEDLNLKEEKKDRNINCSVCSYCLYCRNLNKKTNGYFICNVEVTKAEFEKKIKEMGE